MKRLLTPLAGILIVLATVTTAEAQMQYGAQLSYGDDVDFAVGGRVGLSLDNYLEKLEGVVSFDWFFPGDNQTFWTINANAHYPIPLEGGSIMPYAGAGLGIAYYSYDLGFLGDFDETKFNLNLIAGTKFSEKGSFTPFAELRLPLGGFDGIGFFLCGGVWF
jgi:opacity protein-like surface antigen